MAKVWVEGAPYLYCAKIWGKGHNDFPIPKKAWFNFPLSKKHSLSCGTSPRQMPRTRPEVVYLSPTIFGSRLLGPEKPPGSAGVPGWTEGGPRLRGTRGLSGSRPPGAAEV